MSEATSNDPNKPVPSQLATSALALWFPVVVSGIAVVVWLAILAWLAYR